MHFVQKLPGQYLQSIPQNPIFFLHRVHFTDATDPAMESQSTVLVFDTHPNITCIRYILFVRLVLNGYYVLCFKYLYSTIHLIVTSAGYRLALRSLNRDKCILYFMVETGLLAAECLCAVGVIPVHHLSITIPEVVVQAVVWYNVLRFATIVNDFEAV